MPISIQEILTQLSLQLLQHSETVTLDGQVLLANYLEKPRSWILAHPESLLTKNQYNKIIRAADRLMRGEPLPYVIGHWEFYGLDFHLTRATLIPRPETELLVQQGINWLLLHPLRRKAVDVGTGSGCIGITLAKNIPDLQILLTDISLDALTVARINAEKYGLLNRLEFIQADLLRGIVGPYDLICANLPYIPTSLLMMLPVAYKEPLLALNGGSSGIALINELLVECKNLLAPGGLLLLEIESSQGLMVKKIAEANYPTAQVKILKDQSDQDRCTLIELPNLIVHLCTRDEWLQAQRKGLFQDQSLIQAGFIHCSRPEQILEVANNFYRGIPDLVILWIEPDRLQSKIYWETADRTPFPHIYGPINMDAVVSVTTLKPDLDGNYAEIQLPG